MPSSAEVAEVCREEPVGLLLEASWEGLVGASNLARSGVRAMNSLRDLRKADLSMAQSDGQLVPLVAE